MTGRTVPSGMLAYTATPARPSITTNPQMYPNNPYVPDAPPAYSKVLGENKNLKTLIDNRRAVF